MARNKASVIAVYGLFPFLENFIALEKATSADIKDVTYDILEFQQDKDTADFRLIEKQIYLLDDKGIEVARCRSRWPLAPTQPWVWWNPFSWMTQYGARESVGEVLERVDGTTIYQVLVIETDNYDDDSVRVKLYRVPKTYTLSSWLEELPKRYLRAAEKQVEKIDAKGNNPKLLI